MCECLRPWIAPSRRPSLRQIGTLLASNRPPMRTILAKAPARVLRAPDWSSAAAPSTLSPDDPRSDQAVDLFISPSRFVADEFSATASADRLVVSDGGIDTAGFSDCRPKQATSVVRFGFLGSWMPSKASTC
jgi:hypothetical protein